MRVKCVYHDGTIKVEPSKVTTCYVCRKNDPIMTKMIIYGQVNIFCFDCWAKLMRGEMALMMDVIGEAKQRATIIEERLL